MKKKRRKDENTTVEKLNVIIIKFIIIILLFFSGTILVKKNQKFKNDLYNKLYKNNFSFAVFKTYYNNNIGNIIPFQNIFKKKRVFNDKIEYKSLSKYNKGIKLNLYDNYPIPILKEGIVIYVGEKDKMQTVIVQQSNSVDVWYRNLSNTNVKLYDYVEKNDIIGEAKNNTLYLQYYLNGVEVDYKKFFK